MKFKVFLTVVFFVFVSKIQADSSTLQLEYENSPRSEMIDTDSLMHGLFSDTIPASKFANQKATSSATDKANKSIAGKPAEPKPAEVKIQPADTIIPYIIPAKQEQVHVDSLLFLANPFFIELVYKGLPFDFNWNIQPDYRTLYYGRKATTLSTGLLRPVSQQSAEQTVADLRQYTDEQIIRHAANLYVMTFDDLPDPDAYESHLIRGKSIKNIKFVTDDQSFKHRKLIVKREQIGPWQRKATALLQFSQNYISQNWYQGGNSNVAVLGILSGQLNYDDKKCIQWENSGEWHMGFNSVTGDTLRKLSTNDDVLKLNSKLGVKASGNFFYSANVDFSTQFFNSYNGINSKVMKASFLSPVRLNVGVGLDYKYKKIFSVMVSPVTYKYIYVNDSKDVDPNLFGIVSGERVLKEIGSSLNSTLSYPITHEIQLDSKFNFYTNYKTMQVDWEIVCNMTINRFMSTRISFNPRYDNSVILPQGEFAKMQLKQLLSVGFSHKFY
ncbi:MAG: DUF3078 domain-containing protein [Bacteroidota bacterium]|nr:DUF3078 domain-containing protein [Bacteroidota bacterium]MDP4271807.1 DUF3078 domain-containing protein [Bacteroidota bacterium]